jgi:RNA polymerase sigma factor (sigma-70 family)
VSGSCYNLASMGDERTTAVIQRYLDELAGFSGDAPVEPVIEVLLGRSVTRLRIACTTLLLRSYPRLTQPPLNLELDELLGAVVERLLRALRATRPQTVRGFFGLANQHIRWELNDLARRLDSQKRVVELRESGVAAPELPSSAATIGPKLRRILQTIEALPAAEREAFELVRIQGMSHSEAADVTGVSVKTIQRRLNRSLVLLNAALQDLSPVVQTESSPPLGVGADSD